MSTYFFLFCIFSRIWVCLLYHLTQWLTIQASPCRKTHRTCVVISATAKISSSHSNFHLSEIEFMLCREVSHHHLSSDILPSFVESHLKFGRSNVLHTAHSPNVTAWHLKKRNPVPKGTSFERLPFSV